MQVFKICFSICIVDSYEERSETTWSCLRTSHDAQFAIVRAWDSDGTFDAGAASNLVSPEVLKAVNLHMTNILFL